jgi:hypothetical protein
MNREPASRAALRHIWASPDPRVERLRLQAVYQAHREFALKTTGEDNVLTLKITVK